MKIKQYKKDTRGFAFYFVGNEVYVATVGMVSSLAGQLICHELMKPLNWKMNRKFMDVKLDGYSCIAVGYTIPEGVDGEAAIKQLFQ